MMAGNKFGCCHCKNIDKFKLGSLVQDRHMYMYRLYTREKENLVFVKADFQNIKISGYAYHIL